MEVIRRALPELQGSISATQRLAGFSGSLALLAHHSGLPLDLEEVLEGFEVDRSRLVLDDDPISEGLIELISLRADPFAGWSGTAMELLEKLRGSNRASDRNINFDGWTPQRLGRHLSAITPAMTMGAGISIIKAERTAAARGWTIQRIPVAKPGNT